MLSRFILPIVLCLFLLTGCDDAGSHKRTPVVEYGLLDLSGWDFSKSGIISPRGKWVFYKDRYLAMSDEETRAETPIDAFVSVPGRWSNDKDLNGDSISPFGFATYHLKIIDVSPFPGSTELVIYLPHVRAASEMYIKTERQAVHLTSKNGQTGTGKETYRPWYGGLEGKIDSRGVTDVFIHISNFDDAAVQGIDEQFYIGTSDQITRLKNSRRHWDFIMIGMIIFAGAFMLVFFPLRRSELAPLWLGIFSLSFALRIYVLRLYAFEYLADPDWFDILFRANYFTIYALPVTYTAFLRSIFPDHFSRPIAFGCYAIAILFAFIVHLTPPAFISSLFEPYTVFLALCLAWVGYGQLKAIFIRRDVLSVMTLVGSSFIIITAGYDIVTNLIGFEFKNSIQFGFTLNILCMSIVVSIHNARERNRVERLTAELSREVVIRKDAEEEISMLYRQLAERAVDTDDKLQTAQKELMKSEHKTEIADLTTGTLHNVKNVLTSVKISTELLKNAMQGQFAEGYLKAVDMLKTKMTGLIEHTSSDPKAKLLFEYFIKLESVLKDEDLNNKGHIARILDKISAIEEIISSQQRYGGIENEEPIDPVLVLDDALSMQLGTMSKRQIRINRIIDPVPHIRVQKVKLLHVLINLIKNAIEAMINTPEQQKIMTVETHSQNDKVQIVIRDNGHGIASHNLDKVFSRGFTTKKEGHGFGLNSSFNYVNEMGGTITCKSEGLDKGTTFILEFELNENKG